MIAKKTLLGRLPHAVRVNDPIAEAVNRRRALAFLAATTASGWLAGCGGGGSGTTPPAPSPSEFAGTTFLGEPAGLFDATPSTASIQGLTEYTISTNAQSQAYDYLAVVYSWDGQSWIVDYPKETAPGQLRVVAPLGRPSQTAVPVAGPVQVAVVRIKGTVEEISSVFTLNIAQPPIPTIHSFVLAAALLAGTGAYRNMVVARSTVPGSGAFNTLTAIDQSLFSANTARAFAEIGADENEETSLRLYLAALFSAAELRPEDYITQVVRPASALIALSALDDSFAAVTAGFNIDFDRLGRDLADKARGSGNALIKVGGVAAIAGAVLASPAAIATGAVMIGVGLSIGLVNGFLLDNLGAFGSLGPAQQLRVADTFNFYVDSVSSYALPLVTGGEILPAAATNSIRERAGAFLYEVAQSEVIGRIATNARAAITNLSNLDIGSAWGIRVSGISQQWEQWRMANFGTDSFPSQTYRAVWSPAPSPAPAPPPPGGGTDACGRPFNSGIFCNI